MSSCTRRRSRSLRIDVGGMEGIYELTGDKCKMCLVDTDQKKARPTEFKSESGSGFKLVTLKRIVEKKDAKLPQQVSLPAQGKEKTDRLLGAVYSLLKDLTALVSNAPELVRNTDIAAELKSLAAVVDFNWIAQATQQLGQVQSGMRRNVLRPLSLDAFALALER